MRRHHSNETRNNFYGTQYDSSIELIFNENSGTVKSFGSINYEGTQAKVDGFKSEEIEWKKNETKT